MRRSRRRAGELAAAAMTMLMATTAARAADQGATMRAVEPDPAHVAAAVRLMTDLRAESARHAAAIRNAYAPAVPRLALTNRTGLEHAIATGSILALPPNLAAHNLRPRLTGRHPIGEADLDHQHLYVAARPETIGLLLDLGSRVRSGPLEITSLARHDEYQRRLARTNANARAAVPTHVMGLAFDISILHTPLAHAAEIRDVLRDMARAGDLHFVAEQRQLVFHVVPSQARRAHYAALGRHAGVADLQPDSPQLLRAAADDSTADAIAETAPSTTGARSTLAHLLHAGAGALVSSGAPAWWPVVMLAIVGVVTSDLIMLVAGRAASAPIARPPGVASHVVAKRLAIVLRRWGSAAVVVARFTPGLRALVFVSAGARGMRPLAFAVIDLCAAILWVPLMMLLGAWALRAVVAAAPVSLEAWV